MKSIGYLLASLSVAGLLGVAVAAQAADKTATDKAATDKTLTEKSAAAEKPDCDKAGRHQGGLHHGYKERGHDGRGDRFARDGFEGSRGKAHLEKILGLTEDQQKTLAAAREKERASALALREKAIAAREAIFTAAENNASDEELAKLAANSASLRAQLELGRVKAHRQLVAILTPEQKQKLTEWEAGHKPVRREPI